MGEVLALLSLGMFSANILITKAAANRLATDVGIVIAVAMNVAVSSLLVLGELLYRGAHVTWSGKGVMFFVLAGIFSTYLGRWFFFETIVRLGPVRASAFQVSNPIFTVLIAWILLGDAITGGTAVAIIAVLLGLVLVSYIPGAITGGADPSASTREANSAASTGEVGFTASKRRLRWQMVQFLLPLTSSLVYAIGNVLRGVGVQIWNEPIIGAFLGAAGGFVLYLFTSPVVWRLFQELQRADRMGAGLYALGGMLTIGAQTCVIAAMRHMPISVANLITLSTPVVVTPVSYFLFRNREQIMVRTVLGLTLVMGGIVFLVLR